jgi:single-strand DNA-binding protein
MNKICLIGNLIEDPRTGKTKSGRAWATFRIAVRRCFVTEDGPKTDFLNCVAWGSTGEFIGKYWIKGKPIALTGSLQSRDYTDKYGNKRTAYEVVIDTAEFVGPANAEPASDASGDEPF